MQRTGILALVLLCCLGSVALAGDDATNDGHAIPGHHIETSGGVAYHDGKSGAYTGIEYEYRFSQLVGVGAFADTTFGGFDLAAFGAVANFHPQGGWKLLAGLGLERKIGGDKDKALLRVGAAYEFHVGNGTIAPVIAYDVLEDTKDVLYAGVAIGFAF
jgi:hypothetical protein